MNAPLAELLHRYTQALSCGTLEPASNQLAALRPGPQLPLMNERDVRPPNPGPRILTWLRALALAKVLRPAGTSPRWRAESGDLVVGREDEIDRVVSFPGSPRTAPCSCVVGKTAIAEGLAQRIARDEVSGVLAGARIYHQL